MPDAADTTQLNPHPAQARPDRRCAQAATQGVTTSSYGLGRDFNAPIAFPEAVLMLRAVSPAVWDALPPDVLVAERQAELAVARLLAGAREAAEADDWEVIGRLLAEAKVRYAAFPWVIEVLEGMAETAGQTDTARFRKEALCSGSRMSSRLAAKEPISAPGNDAPLPSFLRRKKFQGKAEPGGQI